MAHVVTQNCCNDATCVSVCPVNCIHPTPEESGYATSEMLYIDPETCIDCGACVEVCPVNAITPDFELVDSEQIYLEVNAQYFADPTHRDYDQAPVRTRAPSVSIVQPQPLRVAVVGSGPSALYAVEELKSYRGLDVEVTIFERLPSFGGLVRYGVAPDHQSTKSVDKLFMTTARRAGVSVHLNVEVGSDLSLAELLRHHHAVIWAGGASSDRQLGIPGEGLSGSHAATDFVAWYNGHPEHTNAEFDLTCERAVIIGNGNVALDVARVLTTPVDELARTDIAQHALDSLAASKIREVVIMGRRGPGQAAFTTPELVGLISNDALDVTVLADDLGLDATGLAATDPPPGSMAELKVRLIRGLPRAHVSSEARQICLRFLGSPIAIKGADRVTGVSFARTELDLVDGRASARTTDTAFDIDCGLVLRSIGYRGSVIPDLPFDETTGTVPNIAGRVIDPGTNEALAGLYTAGWIKRGPSGVIGTNKRCSRETVRALIEDYSSGKLPAPEADAAALAGLLAERKPDSLTLEDWRVIDKFERSQGRSQQRARTKLVTIEELLATARSSR
ncbi:4Fe-4S dicluster domain-containing protein [Rhodococcus sp. ABRD24]|uniref:4Fe-4S binding protein n=1 Tax=Rhodococcus sp. ABRD24 TaxID=2507582 RepID=UPI00103D8238|nr:4Fe-4S binding protein [Rhodococcus sp. ABRD24]QBJ97190.1 4Fe-4S dicluster domain-containing protein [Rhodococcus sp. ABRD24]